MKKGVVFIFLFVLLLGMCACRDVTGPSGEPSSSGQQLGSQPSSSTPRPTFQKPTNTKPNPTTTAPEIVLPENCDEGHTFPNEAPNCAVCGNDYYAATLDIRLSHDHTYYIVGGLGDCTRTTVIVPETYNGLPVEEIFSLRDLSVISSNPRESHITHVVLPDTIKSIDSGAFEAFSSLISINIPDGVPRIENRTFHGCVSLVSLTLPESVTYIGEYAFGGCAKLKDLHIPEGVTDFGEGAFNCCSSLEEIRIPEQMTRIPNHLAAGCKSLKRVIYGNNITIIGQGAFRGCVSLKTFTIGENVTIIDNGAFREAGLVNIVVPNTVTEIGGAVFMDCKNLESIVIGTGVKKIGNFAFQGCSKLKAIFYQGTSEQWERIQMRQYVSDESAPGGLELQWVFNPQIQGVTNCFYSETAPTEEGNYWHYVDGVPTPWPVLLPTTDE